MRRFAAAAVAAAAVVAAGCGSGGGAKGVPGGAGEAPADTVAFVSLKTDPGSGQWKQALKLAARFPGLAARLDELDRYKDAVGPELDVVWLDFAHGGDDVVALTKPRKLAKLKTLVEPNSSTYSKLDGGWVAIADNRTVVDRFKHAASGDKLDADAAFKKGFGKLDDSAAARAWVRGGSVQSALDRALERQGAAPRITHDAGDLRSIAAAARAVTGGVSFDAYGLIDPEPDAASYKPALQDAVPAGPLLYVSTAGLDRPIRSILRMVGDSKPNFDRQLQQVQGVLNIDLKRDVYPLLKGESALALYPGARTPSVLFLQKVGDEAKADGLVRRIAAVAQLSGSAHVQSAQVAGATVQRFAFKGSSVPVFAGVGRGRLFVTTTAGLAREALVGPGRALSAEPLFAQARREGHVPSQVAALAYGDLQRGLPYLFDLARRGGSPVAPATVANTRPLQHAIAYLVPDGDGLRLSGFTAIK